MKKLTPNDILNNEEYVKEREERRQKIIALKRKRRVELGPRISLTFENRETVRYQIQEMIRVERISEEDQVQFEIDTYNNLIPEPGSLSATLFIEITNREQIKTILDRFQGLDQPGMLYLKLDGGIIPAKFEPGHSKEDRISAVHYVTFTLTEEQIRKFTQSQVEIEVRHPEYQATTAFTTDQKEEIVKDLKE